MMGKKGIGWMMVAVMIFSLLATGPALSAQKGKIHLLFMEPWPLNVKYAESVIAEYKKDNPEAEITLDPLGFGDFLPKVTAMKASGNPPDLVYTIPDHMWTLQQNKWLMPVDDVITRLGGDNYFQPLAGYVKKDGHYWGVPYSSYTMHLEYRKDLFAKKGLKEPRTWDDLLNAAKALTEDTNNDGQIDRYGIALPLKREYVVGVMFLSFLWGNGGHVLDKDGKVVFNSPETIQTLNFLKELYKYAPPGVSGYAWMELATTYVADKAAITMFSALKPLGDAIGANKEIAKSTGIAAFPTRLQSQKPKGRWANMSWMVMEGSKYPELAKDFVAFWMEPKRLTNYYHADPIFVVPGEIPIIKSAEYWKNELLAEYKPAIEKMIELNVAGVDPNMENPGVLQPATGIITQRLVITDCVQEVVLGQATAEQAAAKAHKKMEEIMVELKKK